MINSTLFIISYRKKSAGNTPSFDLTVGDLKKLRIANPVPLPLLQVALAELEQRKQENLLRLADYEAICGIEGAIERHAQAVINRVVGEAGDERLLEPLFFQLLNADRNLRITLRAVPRKELVAGDKRRGSLIDAFLDWNARLLMAECGPDGEPIIRLAHLVLLSRWPRLRDFLTRERENLALRWQLEEDAAEWEARDQDRGLLMHDSSKLEHAKLLVQRFPDALPARLCVYVDASLRWHIGREVFRLVSRGRFKAAIPVIGANADVHYTDDVGNTALILAAHQGHEAVVGQLLKAGADPHHADQNGWTALMGAAHQGHEAVVGQLLEAGADPHHADQNGVTAFMLAEQEGHTTVAQLLTAAKTGGGAGAT